MIKYSYFILISSISLFLHQTSVAQSGQNPDTRLAGQCIQDLTEVLVHDITSPPVASRDYVYPMIAFFEAMRPADSSYPSFAGRLNGLQPIPAFTSGQTYDWVLAGVTAFYTTANAFVFSKDLFRQAWDSVDKLLKQRPIPEPVYDRSIQYGQLVAAHILKWSREDHYIHMRTMPRFTPGKHPGDWQQTGPDYMEAIEPHWDQLRPMVLEKAHQFVIPEPVEFNSPAYLKEVHEVYDVSQHLTKEQENAARFWDCNPFATQTIGHLMYSVKKVSPGGHWIGITNMAIGQKRQGPVAALYAYSMVSVAIFEAILSAWDEKYRSNYIRPITAIQQTFAPTWQPILQTPPFPEYPSGHSVISMSAATVLTALYGDHFNYVDSVEKEYGLPERPFSSFIDAANEAAISRMYGGIHFTEAIVNGKLLGKWIGEVVLQKCGPVHAFTQ